jgi:hypothetical protein
VAGLRGAGGVLVARELTRGIQPHEVLDAPAPDRVVNYPATFRVGSTGYLEEWVEDCTCGNGPVDVGIGHALGCGWSPVIKVDAVLAYAKASSDLRELSSWVDAHQGARDPEAIMWGRISKIGVEFGAVVDAVVAATGQNPRKPSTDDYGPVSREIDDVALAAVCANEHMHKNDGRALDRFVGHVLDVATRMREVRARQTLAERDHA